MTITCSHCGCPFVPDSDRTVVACDWCGHRTFNPYWRDEDEDDEDTTDYSALPATRDAGEEEAK